VALPPISTFAEAAPAKQNATAAISAASFIEISFRVKLE
jgi:hypothetical protein